MILKVLLVLFLRDSVFIIQEQERILTELNVTSFSQEQDIMHSPYTVLSLVFVSFSSYQYLILKDFKANLLLLLFS